MDILNDDVYKRVANRGVFKNNNLIFDVNYIPFYMNHNMYFYCHISGKIYNIDDELTLECKLFNLLQITTQENFVICNDANYVYICTDTFEILDSYKMKNITNFIVLGHEVIFKCMTDGEFYSVKLTTRQLCKYNSKFKTVTNDISSYMNTDEDFIICDTYQCPVPLTRNFKFGGSVMRMSHVIQVHYSKYIIDSIIDEVVTHKMSEICEKVKDIQVEDEHIYELFEKHYVDNLINNCPITERPYFKNERIILTGNLSRLTDEALYYQLMGISDDLVGSGKFIPVGLFYYYPPMHALNWHTNLESEVTDKFRAYIIYCNKNYSSFFCYRNPYSGLIHVIADKKEYMNIFDIGNVKTPLWHSVINPDISNKRLSLGFLINVSESDGVILRRRICD